MTQERRNDVLPKIFIVFLTVFVAGLWGIVFAVSGRSQDNKRRVEVVENVFKSTQKETNRRLGRIEASVDKIFDKLNQ